MIIKSKGKEFELTYKARQMIRVGDEIGGQYELESGAYKGDIKTLAKMISIFSNALSYEEALDAIDELLENGETVKSLYASIFDELNKKAFFTRELEITELPPIDYETYVQKMADEMGNKISESTLKASNQ